MTGYIVEGKSRRTLRAIAKKMREVFNLEDRLFFPIVEVLDVLYKMYPGFSYEVVTDDELPEWEHAETDVLSGEIRIKETVYNRACEGEGRDRMTIAHEVAHYITLVVLGFKFASSAGEHPAYVDPEWQAKCLAAELMIDFDLVRGMSASEVSLKCGVSEEAANYQIDKYSEESGWCV